MASWNASYSELSLKTESVNELVRTLMASEATSSEEYPSNFVIPSSDFQHIPHTLLNLGKDKNMRLACKNRYLQAMSKLVV